MKRVLFAALAALGFAACSNSDVNEIVAPEQPQQLTLYATQAGFDTSRVEIGSDASGHPTALSWSQGDKIELATATGLTATLAAEEVDGKSATFRGEAPVGYQTRDSYYAAYPASLVNINKSVYSYTVAATQSGLAKDAVVLYGATEGEVENTAIEMTFKPVNTLLYVTVSNAPSGGFNSVTLRGFDNETLCGTLTASHATPTTFDYTSSGLSITINGSEANGYLSEGFYISLPSDISFTTGYVLSFESREGVKVSFGYKAGELASGAIYGTTVKWAVPTVTLGAKTNYSYAAGVNGVATASPSTANGMDGLTLYFGSSNAEHRSSYANVQNAMIVSVGFEIDSSNNLWDVTLDSESDSAVVWDKSTKTFWYNDTQAPDRSYLGDYTVKAFIKIKHNDSIVTYKSAPETLSVTGIPYSVPDCTSVSFANVPGWDTTGTVEYWSGRGWQTFYYYQFGSPKKKEGALYSPTFYTPASTDVDYTASMCYWTSGAASGSTTIYSGVTTEKNAVTTNSKSLSHVYRASGQAPKNDQYTNISHTVSIPQGDSYRIYISDAHGNKDNLAENWVCMRSFEVKYAE